MILIYKSISYSKMTILFQMGTCGICFENTIVQTACVNNACTGRMCEDCLLTYSNQNKSGQVLNVQNFCCPFCRKNGSSLYSDFVNEDIKAVIQLSKQNPSGVFYNCPNCSSNICVLDMCHGKNSIQCPECKKLYHIFVKN